VSVSLRTILSRRPPPPWARWDDGTKLGWRDSLMLWKSFLFPYRTAELKGFDEETFDLDLGPWKWHRPDVLARRSKET